MAIKIIERPVTVEKKTNLDELLAELRNKLHAYILTCKNCKQFQDDCWRILQALEKENEKKSDFIIGKYTLREDSLDSVVIFKSDGEAGSFPTPKLEKKIDEFWDKEF